jgi:Zn/Cd-binding protein ZinT
MQTEKRIIEGASFEADGRTRPISMVNGQWQKIDPYEQLRD